MISDKERQDIIKVLTERIGGFSCPICHKGHFSLVDGFSSHALTDDYHIINLDGKIIPFVMLVCDNCGFVSQHALGSLGILPKQEEIK